MADDVRLTVGATAFGAWEALTLDLALDSCADAFSFSSPFDPARDDLRTAFRPFGYQAATVSIDGERILTGTIEQVAPVLSDSDRVINVQGRSLTGVLVDCAVDGVGFEFSGLTLGAIARRLIAPFGLTVSLPGGDSAKLKEARVEPGETVFEALARLSESVGYLVTCDAAGGLVLGKVNPTAAPVAAIVEGAARLKAVAATYNGTARFSRYKVLAQQDGKGNIVGTAADAAVKVYRPKIITGSEADAADVTKAAEWARALGLAGSVAVSLTVEGWRHAGGGLWKPGQVVTLEAPSAYVLRETPFLVSGVTLTFDVEAGRTAALRLALPATYTGTMPGGYPWD